MWMGDTRRLRSFYLPRTVSGRQSLCRGSRIAGVALWSFLGGCVGLKEARAEVSASCFAPGWILCLSKDRKEQ